MVSKMAILVMQDFIEGTNSLKAATLVRKGIYF